ncbi:MAG: hypothetical protein HY049_20150 [Acidobacteria bacterium]|nr:hypothetical protein [Acidobacteriota bacterium]
MSALRVIAGAALLASLAGCSGVGSTAADPYIAQAADAEERAGLTAARDDIDAEMSAVAAEKDREIERLKQENAELRSRIAARKKS